MKPFSGAILLLLLLPSCGDTPFDWGALPADLRGGLAVYGDSRTGHFVQERIIAGIASIAPASVFHMGDLVEDGNSEADWAVFNRIVSGLPPGTPFYPALGNHDKASPLYFGRFNLPGNERWYSLNQGGIHCVILDTGSDLAAGSEQALWLEADLAATASSWTVAFTHHPPFSTGEHGGDEKGLKAALVPVLEAHGADLVFSGHDHDYERSEVNGITYVVTGGGGAPLRGQAGENPWSILFAKAHHFCVLHRHADGELSVDVVDWTGGLVDRFAVD